MSFLKLLKSIPADGDITPELQRRLHKAAVALLRGQEIGGYDPQEEAASPVTYEDHAALEEPLEPEIIEREKSEFKSNSELEQCSDSDGDGGCRDYVLLVRDKYDRELPIATGSDRYITQMKRRLDFIRAQKGYRAYQKAIKRLRKEYLEEFYEKRD